MKKLIVVGLLVLLNSCSNQIIKNNLNENTKEYFDINKYKDWEIDTKYSPTGKDKYLKKGEERISIEYFNDAVQIELNNINSPYYKFKKFSLKTNRLLLTGTEFYKINIGIWENYDETGQLIKKIDYDKPYKFSIEDLIKKMKNEYDIDLLDVERVSYVSRYEEKKDVNLPLYEVCYKYSSLNNNKVEYYLINGTTGETLFTIKRYLGDKQGSLLDNYLDSLKSEKQK